MAGGERYYVRAGDTLFCPVYLIGDGGARLVASRFGALDHVWPPNGRPLSARLVAAGATLDEALAFAQLFYTPAAKAPPEATTPTDCN